MSKRILVVEDQPDSRQIIRDMLAAAFRFGPGAVYSFAMPYRTCVSARARGNTEILEPRERPLVARGTQRDNRQIIRDMLAPTDYEITEAENGEEALAAIAKQRPDLILMDIQLPIMDGYTATSRIKADPALR